MKIITCCLSFLIFKNTFCQNDSVKITFSAYVDLYFSHDFAKPPNKNKPNFVYNHKRHNELNVNLFLAKLNYIQKNVRANIGIMVGNYAQFNLSAEPQWAQFIYEANAGIKLSKSKNVWLDVGIMPSHIGFESAISADCYTLTRSILAENSPYFETAAKLGYTSKNEKVNTAFLILNGWQRIKRVDGKKALSAGMQVNYKPNKKLTLNYSNFLGSDKPDSIKAFRHFHNFYVQFEPNKKIGFIAGFDIGSDKYNATNYGIWFSPIAIVRYKLNSKLSAAFRAEYFDDVNQIMISVPTVKAMQVFGTSINFDYTIIPKLQWRIEGKLYTASKEVFLNNQKNNGSITTNLTFKL